MAVSEEKDPFEEIFLSEDRFHSQGYQEGFDYGSGQEDRDAYATGFRVGAEIGEEVGYYFALSETLLEMAHFPNHRCLKAVQSLLELVTELIVMDIHNPSFPQKLEQARSKNSQVSSLLKLDKAFQPKQCSALSKATHEAF